MRLLSQVVSSFDGIRLVRYSAPGTFHTRWMLDVFESHGEQTEGAWMGFGKEKPGGPLKFVGKVAKGYEGRTT